MNDLSQFYVYFETTIVKTERELKEDYCRQVKEYTDLDYTSYNLWLKEQEAKNGLNPLYEEFKYLIYHIVQCVKNEYAEDFVENVLEMNRIIDILLDCYKVKLDDIIKLVDTIIEENEKEKINEREQ